MDNTLNKKGRGSALIPFLVFVVIYLGAGLILQAQGTDMAFYQFPSVTAMFIAVLVAFCMTKGSINDRFRIFAKGAANEDVLTMLMIYLLAGAFSGTQLLHVVYDSASSYNNGPYLRYNTEDLGLTPGTSLVYSNLGDYPALPIQGVPYEKALIFGGVVIFLFLLFRWVFSRSR